MILNSIFGRIIIRIKFFRIRTSGTMSSPGVQPLVVCGPSGSGKSTLLNKLMEEFSDCFKFSISHTTRRPRRGETDGKEYHFVDRETFEQMIRQKKFIEFTQFSANYYGTSYSALEEVQKSGRIAVLDVELEGVRSLKRLEVIAKYVFIKPPNFETLERNLRSRGSETEDNLQRRLQRAKEDVREVEANPGLFDLVLINDNLEVAYNQLKQFLRTAIDGLKRGNR